MTAHEVSFQVQAKNAALVESAVKDRLRAYNPGATWEVTSLRARPYVVSAAEGVSVWLAEVEATHETTDGWS